MSKGKISKVLVANRGEISCRAQVGSLESGIHGA